MAMVTRQALRLHYIIRVVRSFLEVGRLRRKPLKGMHGSTKYLTHITLVVISTDIQEVRGAAGC